MLSLVLLSMPMITLYSKCGQSSYLWQQLEIVAEFESDLWDTVAWGMKWFVDFTVGKTQLFSFDQSNNTSVIDVKLDGSVLGCFGCLSLINWIGALILSLLLKLPPRKFKSLFVLWSFFLLKLLCVSIEPPYSHAWNTVVMSGLLLLAAT